jgi:hypothetical protein
LKKSTLVVVASAVTVISWTTRTMTTSMLPDVYVVVEQTGRSPEATGGLVVDIVAGAKEEPLEGIIIDDAVPAALDGGGIPSQGGA